MTYTIAEPCVDIKDKACIEECPVDCIYEGARMLYIHPDECVDCGACEPVCPVEAIYYEDDVPDQWSSYTQLNADFFAGLGSPAGPPRSARPTTTLRWSRTCRLRARTDNGSPFGVVAVFPWTRWPTPPRSRGRTLTASSTCRSALPWMT